MWSEYHVRSSDTANSKPIIAPAPPHEAIRNSRYRAETTDQLRVTLPSKLFRRLGETEHPANTEPIEARSPVRPPWHVLHAHSVTRTFA